MITFILKLVVCALLVVAAVIDARSRRFPNDLAAALALVCIVFAFCAYGLTPCVFNIVRSLAFCGALLGSEMLFRHFRGTEGVGMGDIKAVFSLLILSFRAGAAGFCAGLLVLAGVCVARRTDSLPALPCIIPCFLLFWMVFDL